MSVRTRAVPQTFDQTVIRSRLAYHWRAEDLALQALTRQALTFSRASTSTGLDRAGTSYTAGHHQPAWAIVDGRAFHRVGFGGTAETWQYAWDLAPGAGMVGYIDLVDRGMVDGWPLHIGAGSTGTSSLTVRQVTGGAWELALRHGAGLAVATASPTTTAGDRVGLFWTLTPAGAMQLRVATGWTGDQPAAGDYTTGTEVDGFTLPATWAEPDLRLGVSGQADIRRVKLAIYRLSETLEGL